VKEVGSRTGTWGSVGGGAVSYIDRLGLSFFVWMRRASRYSGSRLLSWWPKRRAGKRCHRADCRRQRKDGCSHKQKPDPPRCSNHQQRCPGSTTRWHQQRWRTENLSLEGLKPIRSTTLSVALLLASQEAMRPAEARLRMRLAAFSHEDRRLATSARWETSFSYDLRVRRKIAYPD
jgi:hypothetical protein